MADYVYLAARAADKCFKIGCTGNIANRMSMLAQEHAGFEILHKIETNNARRLESEFHEMFADKRRDGEWFELTGVDMHKIVFMNEKFYETTQPMAYKPTAVTRSFRLTDEADKLLQAIADKYGISKTAALEIVIRNQAKLEKVA